MKKIIGLVVILLMLLGCKNDKYNYRITSRYVYYTNEYRTEGNCITFKTEGCSCNSKEMTVIKLCGNYEIVELKHRR